MAIGLAEAGCDIVGVNIVEPDDTARQVETRGRRFLSIKVDLSDTAVTPAVIAQAVAAFGHVDILANNAGIIRRQDAIEFSEKNWDDVMDLNIKSLFFIAQTAARQFIQQGRGGKIINIASMLSYQCGIRVPSYYRLKKYHDGRNNASDGQRMGAAWH